MKLRDEKTHQPNADAEGKQPKKKSREETQQMPRTLDEGSSSNEALEGEGDPGLSITGGGGHA